MITSRRWRQLSPTSFSADAMSQQPIEPDSSLADPRTLLINFLDHYRETLFFKINGLTDDGTPQKSPRRP